MTDDEEKINKRFPPYKSTTTVRKSEIPDDEMFSENSFAKSVKDEERIRDERLLRFDGKRKRLISSKNTKSKQR